MGMTNKENETKLLEIMFYSVMFSGASWSVNIQYCTSTENEANYYNVQLSLKSLIMSPSVFVITEYNLTVKYTFNLGMVTRIYAVLIWGFVYSYRVFFFSRRRNKEFILSRTLLRRAL